MQQANDEKPAADAGPVDLVLGPEVDAGKVVPGPALYEVTYAHNHKTLKAGNLVRMVEDPRYNNLLLRTDWTLHWLTDEQDQYVHLRLVPMEAMA